MRKYPVGLADLLNGVRVPSIVDSYGRAFTYLRISVTDLCNFRCVYCMLKEGLRLDKHCSKRNEPHWRIDLQGGRHVV